TEENRMVALVLNRNVVRALRVRRQDVMNEKNQHISFCCLFKVEMVGPKGSGVSMPLPIPGAEPAELLRRVSDCLPVLGQAHCRGDKDCPVVFVHRRPARDGLIEWTALWSRPT